MRSIKIGILLGIRQIQRASLWTNVLIVFVMALTFLNLIAVSLLLLACVVTTIRLTPLFQSLGSIREFILSPAAREAQELNQIIFTSCIEAPDHYNYYTTLLGQQTLQFAPLQNATGHVLLLADDRLCPIGQAFEEIQEVWTPKTGGFRLFRGNIIN